MAAKIFLHFKNKECPKKLGVRGCRDVQQCLFYYPSFLQFAYSEPEQDAKTRLCCLIKNLRRSRQMRFMISFAIFSVRILLNHCGPRCLLFFAMHSYLCTYIHTYMHPSILTCIQICMQHASIHETCSEYESANQTYLHLCFHKHAHTHTCPRVRAHTHTHSLSLSHTHT